MEPNNSQQFDPRIHKTLEAALTSEFSAFYRHKYDDKAEVYLGVNNYADFQQIPLLCKNELLEVAWEQRTFVPQSEIAFIGITSGTSDINRPMTVPISKEILKQRATNSTENILSTEKVQKHQLKRILCMIPGALNFYYGMMYFPNCGAIPIPGDYRDLEGTAKLCDLLEADGIITIPTLLMNLSSHLEKLRFNLGSIRWISLQGELVSQEKLDLIKKKFPNAKLEMFYGSNEMMHRGGYHCENRSFDLNTYHPGSKFFFEILDENRNPVPSGEFGNLVITDLDPQKPLPLIRYQTGDVATLEPISCGCGNNQLLTIGGRKDYDLLRIFGLTFSAEALDNVLASYLDNILGYELHLSEKLTDGKLLPSLTLVVAPRSETSLDLQELPRQIRLNYYLSKDKTLGYFEDNGIVLPLQVTVGKLSGEGKQKRIILDL